MRSRLIDNPGLYCARCVSFKRNNNKPMLCETKKGCPISDIAPNPKANKIVETYIQAKSLANSSGLAIVQEQAFRRCGLLDDHEILFEFEKVWLDFTLKSREKRRKENQKKTNTKPVKKRAKRGIRRRR